MCVRGPECAKIERESEKLFANIHQHYFKKNTYYTKIQAYKTIDCSLNTYNTFIFSYRIISKHIEIFRIKNDLFFPSPRTVLNGSGAIFG